MTCDLEGLLTLEPHVFRDSRGYFLELWNQRCFAENGGDATFVQDNLSFSERSTLRGLHFQNPSPQAKLVTVLCGEVLDVVVDLRRSSATFGRWQSLCLSEMNKRQWYIPIGFAHGFLVLSDTALFHYKCTAHYAPEHEHSLRWNDACLGIDWPIPNPILSSRDAQAPLLSEIPPQQLFP